VYLTEGDIEGREGSLVSDGLGVDEEAAVVLRLEQLVVVAVGVGGVVEEDHVQVPSNHLPLVRCLHM
jgi:hypothetical protein